MKSTPKKRGEQVKARTGFAELANFDGSRDSQLPFGIYKHKGTLRPEIPVVVLPASPESIEAIHREIRISMDWEDGTGAGYDHAAWMVMKRLGLTDKKFPAFIASITPTPRASQRRKKKV